MTDRQTDRQTDHTTHYSVGNSRLHLRAMRSKKLELENLSLVASIRGPVGQLTTKYEKVKIVIIKCIIVGFVLQ